MIGPCIACKWARFQMTNHKPPRVKQKQFGDCDWPVPEPPPLAISVVRGGYWYFFPEEGHTRKVHIWPDYANCPVWEEKDE